MSQPSNIEPNRLLAMLSGAKNIMNKVESGDFTKGHVDESRLNNNVDGMLSSIPNGAHQQNEYAPRPVANTQPSGQKYQNLHTSKMPANILKATTNNGKWRWTNIFIRGCSKYVK
jgi:hypothetical protein